MKDAHVYTWAQFDVLHLVMSYISDIKHDRANTINMEHRTTDIEGYRLHGKKTLEIVNDIRFQRLEYRSLLYATVKNLFRGTTHPVYEVTKNPRVKKLITLLCFSGDSQFDDFLNMLSIIRHFLSHNYSPDVIIRKWDLTEKSTAKNLIDNGKKNLTNKVRLCERSEPQSEQWRSNRVRFSGIDQLCWTTLIDVRGSTAEGR